MGPRLLILVPLVLSIYVLARHSVEKAFLSVYLPILLCFPLYDSLKLPDLPYLTFTETAILPIGIWLLATKWRRWRLTRMDFWMLLFGVSSCATQFIHVSNPDIGLFSLFACFTQTIFPYVIGKLLIEQSEQRVNVMKRIVLLLAFVALGCVYEYRMGINPFHTLWAIVIPPEGPISALDHSQLEQFRWGFTRASGPYSTSELAGMIYVFGTLFAYLLYHRHQWEPKFRWSYHPFEKGTLLFLIVGAGMFVTQARGAYLGLALGYVIARIANASNLRRASIFTVLFLAFVAVPSYKAISTYASKTSSSRDLDQQNAVYRSLMIQNYVPVMEEGGFFGWVSFPVVDGQTSIDNAYLYYGLTQGYVGAVSFSLLIIESLMTLFLSLRKTKNADDQGFVFCAAGAIAGIALCIGTVYLSSPATELLFLLMGWCQSLRCTEPHAQELPIAKNQGFYFRKIFT